MTATVKKIPGGNKIKRAPSQGYPHLTHTYMSPAKAMSSRSWYSGPRKPRSLDRHLDTRSMPWWLRAPHACIVVVLCVYVCGCKVLWVIHESIKRYYMPTPI